MADIFCGSCGRLLWPVGERADVGSDVVGGEAFCLECMPDRPTGEEDPQENEKEE